MLDLVMELLNDPEYRDRDVTQVVCPIVEEGSLTELRDALQREAPHLESFYGVRDGFEILSLERRGLLPLYTDELRVLVSTTNGSCQALVFRKTL